MLRHGFKGIICLVLALCLSACVRQEVASAPIINGWNESQSKSPIYHVRSDDSLYSIAWAFGLDYRSLAAANHLSPPYRISAGQTLNMVVPKGPFKNAVQARARTGARQSYASPAHPNHPYARRMVTPTSWLKPANGLIVKRFSSIAWGNHGVDIKGSFGEPILASADGEVVYAGAGVRGYGNLIILKHSDSYLSAYAYNQRILVREGSWVRKGQKIGTMGRTDAGLVLLHFEIRQNGKPVDPQKYIR